MIGALKVTRVKIFPILPPRISNRILLILLVTFTDCLSDWRLSLASVRLASVTGVCHWRLSEWRLSLASVRLASVTGVCHWHLSDWRLSLASVRLASVTGVCHWHMSDWRLSLASVRLASFTGICQTGVCHWRLSDWHTFKQLRTVGCKIMLISCCILRFCQNGIFNCNRLVSYRTNFKGLLN